MADWKVRRGLRLVNRAGRVVVVQWVRCCRFDGQVLEVGTYSPVSQRDEVWTAVELREQWQPLPRA